MKRKLTLDKLQNEARRFAEIESTHREPVLYGVTDGKAIGTCFEHKFQAHLSAKYSHEQGSSAKGIDFPSLEVDMKVTSIKTASILLSLQVCSPEDTWPWILPVGVRL